MMVVPRPAHATAEGRGVTMVELLVTTAVSAAMLGLLVAIMANMATSRAQSMWASEAHTVAARVLAEVTDVDFEELSVGAQVPDELACEGEPQLACLPVRGGTGQVEVATSSSQQPVAGGWAPAWVDVTATVHPPKVAGGTDLPPVTVRERVAAGDLVSGTSRATVTVVADGAGLEDAGDTDRLPAVYLRARDGSTSSGASFGQDGTATIGLAGLTGEPTDLCGDQNPCRLAIGDGDEWWADDSYTLTAAQVIGAQGAITVAPGQQVRTAATLAARGEVHVSPMARPDGGRPARGAPQGSVCIWAEFSDGLGTVRQPACNTVDSGETIVLDSYEVQSDLNGDGTVDSADRLPIPAGTDLTLLSDRPDMQCPARLADAGQTAARADGTWQAGRAVCTTWTWGRPSEFGRSGSTPGRIAADWPRIGQVEVPAGGTDTYELVWSGREARPAAGYPGNESSYTAALDTLSPVAHLPFDEEPGQAALHDRAAGADHGTVSTDTGVFFGVPGALADSSTAVRLDSRAAPSLLLDTRASNGAGEPVRTSQERDVLRLQRDATIIVSAVLPASSEGRSELASYGQPSDGNGWVLRAAAATRSLELHVNGRTFRSPADAWTPQVWQHIAVSFDRQSSTQATVRFFVDGVDISGEVSAGGAVSVPANRDMLSIGRVCDCVLDEFAIVARTVGADDAAFLFEASDQTREVGGPAWSKPRIQQPCAATATCRPPGGDVSAAAHDRHPYVEMRTCEFGGDRLCESPNGAPGPVGLQAPYSVSPTGAGRAPVVTFADPEGDDFTVKVIETVGDVNPIDRSFVLGAGTWEFTSRSTRPGTAAYATMSLTDEHGNENTIRVALTAGGVVLDLVARTPQLRVPQSPGHALGVDIVGPGGGSIPTTTVTFSGVGSTPPELASQLGAVTTTDYGHAVLELDTTNVSAGDHVVRATAPNGAGGTHQVDMTVTVVQTPGSLVVSNAGTLAQGKRRNVTVSATDKAGSTFAGVVVRGRTIAPAGAAPTAVVMSRAACTTGPSGTCQLEVEARTDAAPGDYQVVASSGGATSAGGGQVQVVSDVARVEVPDTAVTQGGHAELHARVLDGQGRPVPGGTPVSMNLSSGALNLSAASTTNAAGLVPITVTAPLATPPGNSTLTAVARDSEDRAVDASARVRVMAAVGSIELDAPAAAARGNVAVISGRVRDGRQTEPLADATVRVLLTPPSQAQEARNVQVPAMVRTGQDGQVLVPITIGADAQLGTYRIEVASDSGEVVSAPVELSVVDAVGQVQVRGRLTQGSTAEVAITANNVDQAPVAGAVVRMVGATSLDGTAVDLTSGAPVTTGPDGTVSLQVTDSFQPSPGGVYLLRFDLTVPGMPETTQSTAAVRLMPAAAGLNAAGVSVPQGSSSTATVRVVDLTGAPMPGADVTVTAATEASGTIVELGARNEQRGESGPYLDATVVTGPDGVARVPVRAHNVAAGRFADLLRYRVEGASGPLLAGVDVTVSSTPRNLASSRPSASRGSSDTLTVCATDAHNDPAVGVAIDLPVVVAGPARLIPENRRVPTGNDGCATVVYFVPPNAVGGTYRFEPAAGPLRGPTTFEVRE